MAIQVHQREMKGEIRILTENEVNVQLEGQ